MPLPDAGGPDNPGLVDLMRFLVIPIGLFVELGSNAGDDTALFLLEEKFVHNRIDAGAGPGDHRRGAGRRDCQQPAVAQPIPRHFLSQCLPGVGGIAALGKVSAGLPVGAFEIGIPAFFLSQLQTGADRVVIDRFKQLVGSVQVFFRLEEDRTFRQPMVQTADA